MITQNYNGDVVEPSAVFVCFTVCALALRHDGTLSIYLTFFARVCVQVWIEFGRIKLPQGLHPNDLEEEWGKLILEMLEREKVLRPAVERYTHAFPCLVCA